MPKIKKYYPDYAALYPDTPIHPKVIKALRESDRKMKYMEYDLKCEQPLRNEAGAVVGLIPSREDSYERLLEADKQFAGSAPSPEDVFFAGEEIRELHKAVAALDAADRELIEALFFVGQTVQGYALQIGVSRYVVHRRRRRILGMLKKYYEKMED
ncbi:sigma-70 family RNA polymerase sigma factor [Ohessyouella blattaphilus]|uniref:Sigma-70 family RNA polymerase sigma factor n=1 Tax=Ohessyouella blattaphilus TaxID=2949333 RepID=A0ABT1EK93_9FIRM|nr:sigma-70 family RNA polymerase sigma factor [Ohessyouella blattaphilus]MCP1109727.1 sigma-70 family RNA polymerase sigma factor [Ohessyouella blattaphilus]MCR8563121.1 sigma-70 family RNA polymerase sigma factor [Ohessyouella blattaphilus]